MKKKVVVLLVFAAVKTLPAQAVVTEPERRMKLFDST